MKHYLLLDQFHIMCDQVGDCISEITLKQQELMMWREKRDLYEGLVDEYMKVERIGGDMKCGKCGKLVPDEFVQPLFVGGQGYLNVDPECALEVMSEVHGVKMTEFKGQYAQELLEGFRAWKEKQG